VVIANVICAIRRINLNHPETKRKAGAYQVRIAVRDMTSAKIGSVGQFVVVPHPNEKGFGIRPHDLGASTGSALLDYD
jgi:hypothetical protein